jgi:flavin-dependent dehydrogenase
MTWDYDIIIVGSGPSGSSVALHLAQQAPELASRTAVLEMSHHPRLKLCAGALVVDTEVCLRRAGLAVEDVPHLKVSWVHALYEGRGPRMRLDGELGFRVVQRTVFDGWLVDQARRRGVAVQEDTRVLSVNPIAGGFEVKTSRGEYRARTVVGADGAKSTVRRAVRGKTTDGGAHVARTIEIITEPPASGPLPADDASVDMRLVSEGIHGYVWDFPAERQDQRRRNRGVYDSRTVPRAAAAPLPPALDAELGKVNQRLADYELLGAPVRWFNPLGPFAAPGLLLVGDAAGTDALFGEGISSSLAYGELAATALQKAFASGDFSFADYPQAVRHSAMGRAMALRTRTARLFYRLRSPTIQRFIWWRLGPLARWFIINRVFNWAH